MLDVLPVKDPLVDPVAYGRPPSASGDGLASWGGSIVKDPDTSIYHLFAAEMSAGCGLNAWARNSLIRHATAATPLGPFTAREVVLPAFSHEPVVKRLPPSAGGGYVMWKIGCADKDETGSNGTALAGPCTGCGNGTTTAPCPPPNQATYLRRCQDALFARSLSGPWTRHNLTLDAQWDWLHLNSGLVSRHDIAAIWVAFFSRWQRYRC